MAYETKNIHDSAHLHGYGRANGDYTRAFIYDIVGDEVALAALKCLAQNKKISAIFLEQHDKGLVLDYEAIRARVLKEDEVLPIERKYSTTVHKSSPIIATCYTPLYNCQISATSIHCRKILRALGGHADPSRAESKE